MFRIEAEDLQVWEVTLPSASFFELSGDLYSDLERYSDETGKEAAVVLAILFPATFPYAPPFVRVVRPRFCFHTGHVTVGGSICLQILTQGEGKGYWKDDVTMASLLLLLYHLIAVDGKGRVDFGSSHNPHPERDYSLEEAKAAFERVARQHGWLK